MRSPSLQAGRVTLQAGPTFCFSRKQFTTFCKETSLLLMTTFLHINGPWEKSSCLGLHRGLCLPTWLHPAASQPCVNWTEQPSDSLRKQPTFFNTTTGFPMKWRLRNDCRNFILMRCQYPVLGNASDWSFAEGKLQSEALLRSGWWHRTLPVWNFCSHFQTCGEISSGVPKFWLFSQVTIKIVVANQNLGNGSQGKGLNLPWIPQH